MSGRSWQQELSLPAQLLLRLQQIVQRYFQMEPKLQLKERETESLAQCNRKLVQTIDDFRQHEKELISRCTRVEHMLQRTFHEYRSGRNQSSKGVSVEPIPSIFQSFNLEEWVFTPSSPQLETQLLQSIRKHYCQEGCVINTEHSRYQELMKMQSALSTQNMFEMVQLHRQIAAEKESRVQTEKKSRAETERESGSQVIPKETPTKLRRVNTAFQSVLEDVAGVFERLEQLDRDQIRNQLKGLQEHSCRWRDEICRRSDEMQGLIARLKNQIKSLEDESSQIQNTLYEKMTELSRTKSELDIMKIKDKVDRKETNDSRGESPFTKDLLKEDPLKLQRELIATRQQLELTNRNIVNKQTLISELKTQLSEAKIKMQQCENEVNNCRNTLNSLPSMAGLTSFHARQQKTPLNELLQVFLTSQRGNSGEIQNSVEMPPRNTSDQQLPFSTLGIARSNVEDVAEEPISVYQRENQHISDLKGSLIDGLREFINDGKQANAGDTRRTNTQDGESQTDRGAYKSRDNVEVMRKALQQSEKRYIELCKRIDDVTLKDGNTVKNQELKLRVVGLQQVNTQLTALNDRFNEAFNKLSSETKV